MNAESAATMIAGVGFPAAVAWYLLTKTTAKLSELVEQVTALTVVLADLAGKVAAIQGPQ